MTRTVPTSRGPGLSGLPALAQPDAKPQALHHFTLSDQVNQLVEASEADPDLGFMARLMALCSLPRTNPGNRKECSERAAAFDCAAGCGYPKLRHYRCLRFPACA